MSFLRFNNAITSIVVPVGGGSRIAAGEVRRNFGRAFNFPASSHLSGIPHRGGRSPSRQEEECRLLHHIDSEGIVYSLKGKYWKLHLRRFAEAKQVSPSS